MANVLADVLGIRSSDLKRAEDFYNKMPAEIRVTDKETFDTGFDLCRYLAECVIEALETKHDYLLSTWATRNCAATSFNISDDDKEKLEEFVSDGCEIARFILDGRC